MKSSMTKDIWRKTTPPAKNVTAFVQVSPPATRAKLKQLRQLVHSLVPTVEEKISYKMPAYKYKGQWLVGFAGFQRHIGFYGMSGSFFNQFQSSLKKYHTSKGAIQFPLDQPLPVALIKRLIKARMKLNDRLAKRRT